MGAVLLTLLPCEHLAFCHSTHRSKSLPPETQGHYPVKVVLDVQLACGMAQKSHGNVLKAHSTAVVGYADIGYPSLLYLNGYRSSSAVY